MNKYSVAVPITVFATAYGYDEEEAKKSVEDDVYEFLEHAVKNCKNANIADWDWSNDSIDFYEKEEIEDPSDDIF